MLKLIVLSCLVLAVYSISTEYQQKAIEKLTGVLEGCVPEVGASDNDVAELMQKRPPSTREGKCLVACMSKKLGLMKDGRPSRVGAITAFAALKTDDPDAYDKIFQAIDKCADDIREMDETDECEMAAKTGACIHRVAKEMGVDSHQVLG